MDTFYHGTWRMDWGLGSPNKTAALIAGLMVAVWALAAFKKWGFWTALVIFAALGAALLHTFSRGGIVAVASGLLPVLLFAARPWPRRRVLAVGGVFIILTGYAFNLKATHRYAGGLLKEDKSITNRLELWRAAPAMIVDAPEGWGSGNSGTAYMQWYQPLGRNECYRTMVNSHLTYLVEHGWFERYLYITAWTFIFCLCWPNEKSQHLSAIGLGCWLTLATSSFFSSVGESPYVWFVPSLALIFICYRRCKFKTWPHLKAWIFNGGISLFLVLGTYLIGISTTTRDVSYSDGVLVLGKGHMICWIIPNEEIFGKYFGSDLRKAFRNTLKASSIAISNRFPEAGGKNDPDLLVIGQLKDEEARLEDFKSRAATRGVLLINPWVNPALVGPLVNRSEAWIGQFSGSPNSPSWRYQSQVRLRVFEGIGDYSPGWFDLIQRKIDKTL